MVENRRLRNLLWQSEKKLRSVQATLKNIVDGIAEGKDGGDVGSQEKQGPGEADQIEVISDFCSNTSPGHSEFEAVALNYACLTNPKTSSTAYDVMSSEALPSVDLRPVTTTLSTPPKNALIVGDEALQSADNFDLLPTSTEMQLATSQSVFFPLHRSIQVMAPSKYSEHILAYEMCAVSYQSQRRTADQRRYFRTFKRSPYPIPTDLGYSLNQILTSLVSAFVKIAWQGMESWIHCTNGKDTLARIAAWRISPSAETLAAIPPAVLPTPLQAAVPHPPVIDWCIFPFLRDKLIQYHSADPALDEICGEIGLAYVVQADLSDLVVGAESLPVYFNIHDIISGMQNNPPWVVDGSLGTTIPEVKLPAPDLYTLLHTKEFAREVYHHLGIGRGIQEYHLDSALFTKYPHLYEPSAKVAQGVALKSSNKIIWPHPQPLDEVAMNCYRWCASYNNGHAGSITSSVGLTGF